MGVITEIFNTISRVVVLPSFYYMIFQSAAPILLAALAVAVAIKANAINMGIEGIMTVTSLVCVLVSSAVGGQPAGGPWLGLVVAIIVGGLLGFAVSVFAFRLKIDIILVGIAMNLIGTGASVLLMYVLTGDRTTTTSLSSGTLPQLAIPLLKDIPFLGEVLSGHYVLTYLAYILVFVMSFFLFKTKLGLRIRAVGENEEAAESVGISSLRIKTIALIISGVLGGIAGAFMSECYLAYFSSGLIAGRGFVGLAACNMGSGNPGIICLCCLAFGIFYAFSNFSTLSNLSIYALNALPYAVVLVGVVIYSVYMRKKELKRLQGLESEENLEHGQPAK
ncbi:MAG: ABC transporter permease [Erysipelotrichaceae bacterium]|nr:ABC transporter permease [Erysipelotrichaceae bacterium]MBR3167607.1 ABC transporter permease [Erysipelotrichaceae bacterium]